MSSSEAAELSDSDPSLADDGRLSSSVSTSLNGPGVIVKDADPVSRLAAYFG